ncbi:MAG: methionyl aminopeptidase [Solobacterium sp.]|nr:methionyl aminopeptidase [Solobacterium sp.]
MTIQQQIEEIFLKEPIPAETLEKMEEYRKKGYSIPDERLIKRPSHIQGIKEAGIVNTAVLDEVCRQVHEGMSTQEIDDIVASYTKEQGCICAPYQFEGYPKSVCTSINDEVCHGIPSRHRKLHKGDIVNVDCTTIKNGYFADASRMICIGEVSPERKRLVEETKKCLEVGLAVAKPWNTVGDIGYAIANYAHGLGYSVVRELGGHGVGIEFHEDPFVSHIAKAHTGMLLVPGMVFTIEPMINAGKAGVLMDPYNGWTISTVDGKDSAQWEYTILITETGNEILTY